MTTFSNIYYLYTIFFIFINIYKNILECNHNLIFIVNAIIYDTICNSFAIIFTAYAAWKSLY